MLLVVYLTGTVTWMLLAADAVVMLKHKHYVESEVGYSAGLLQDPKWTRKLGTSGKSEIVKVSMSPSTLVRLTV